MSVSNLRGPTPWVAGEAPTVFRAAAWQRWGLGAMALSFGLLALCSAALAAEIVTTQPPAAAALAAGAALQAALALHLFNEARTRWSLRAELGPVRVVLHLPAGRSRKGGSRAYVGSLAYAEIAAVEAHIEARRWLGLPAWRCDYRLRLRDGGAVPLGEDRAPGWRVPQHMAAQLATQLAERAGMEITYRGLVPDEAGLARR